MLFLLALLACKDGSTPTDDSAAPDDSAVDSEDSAADDTADDTAAPDTRWDPVAEAVEVAIKRGYATGASIAVWVDGEIVYAKGFGSAHPDRDVPVTPNTLFNIGSDTKKLAAITVLQQVAAGRISLDTPLDEALPELKLYGDPLATGDARVSMLLDQTTSFFDDTNFGTAHEDEALAGYAYGDFASRAYFMAEPGAMWNYSNPNYSLAGLVVEVADGRPWGDVVEDDVLRPLGLNRTFARVSDVIADGDYAAGYGIINGQDIDLYDLQARYDYAYEFGVQEVETFPDAAWVRPAGGVWSTASDMASLAGFFLDGDEAVLPDALREGMVTGQARFYPTFDKIWYGHGVMVYDAFTWYDGWHETPLWLHGGNHLAYTSAWYVLPEARIAVSVLSNGYADDFSGAAFQAIEVALDGAELSNPIDAPELAEDPADLDHYVGTYLDEHLVGTIIVTRVGDALQVELPDLSAAGFRVNGTMTESLAGSYTFKVEGGALELTFVAREGEEETTWARNRTFVATRVEPSTARLAPVTINKARVQAALDAAALTPRGEAAQVLSPFGL
ncbi:beta-lactamase family protein [Myxococcota bacterium]|nr:beta-lactamase family protein [Myxococcota bacterium]